MLDPALVKGERVLIGPLSVTGISYYLRPHPRKDQEAVYWRHSMRDAKGRCFIYTGKRLGVVSGEDIYLRCTVKKIDADWNCVRVMRPVVVHATEGSLI